MIIDSHAHYYNNAYKKPFRYLSYDKDGYSLKEGERDSCSNPYRFDIA